MAKRILWNTLTAAVLASALAACGEKKDVDSYPTVTLRQATRGKVVSKGFRYKLANPQVEVLNQNLGLIREGDLVEFIGARSLEEKLQENMTGDFALAVVKEFSPFVHFKVEKIYTATDTIFMTTSGAIVYPKVSNVAEFDSDAYERKDLDDIQYDRTDELRALENKKFGLTAPITRETEDGRVYYYVLHGKNANFRVADTPDGIGLMLKLFVEKGYRFEGGVLMTVTEEYASRMRSKIAGTVEVMYVKYGSRVVSG
jgi:hypothetical protein